jgi:hypothetical protein
MTDLEYELALILPETKPEDMLQLRMKMDCAIRQLQELRRRLDDEHLLPRLEACGGITVGDVRYYAAYTKTTKCLDNSECAEAMLQATNGHLAAFCACLAAGAWLPGACKKVLPAEEFLRLFETTERRILRDGSFAKKQLQQVDRRFITSHAGSEPAQSEDL